MMNMKNAIQFKISNLSFTSHCLLGFVIRLILIFYANLHDKHFAVPYTDVDYKVFTDAARHVVEGRSPFERHTYRYSPFLAWLLTPNVVLHKDFGKVLFSVIDVLIALLIKNILTRQKCNETANRFCALLWLYNPLTLVITTRGNADSLAVLLVILTLDLFQKDDIILSGLLHGLSVHFRLYPLMFSLPMFLSLCENNRFLPNTNQWKLVLSCAFSIVTLTATGYYLYGFTFLYESVLYHLVRQDTRHNFSVYFYMLYLSADQPQGVLQKILIFLPRVFLLLLTSYFYSEKSKLPFAMFIQTMIAVIYNSVITSQYFFWFLSLLPLCLPNLKASLHRCVWLTCSWIFGQSVWLLAAYVLEFQGINSFTYLWLSGLLLFVVNVNILINIIRMFRD